jgi:hypothetical protein
VTEVVTHELWRQRDTGQVWAVELRDGIVVACDGPLHHDDADPAFLEGYNYTLVGADRIERDRDQFTLVCGPDGVLREPRRPESAT